jgi:nucleotide-binding universal stress UspA family protein
MKILLPIDGSDCANKTMDWAMDTFDKGSTNYYLVHVIPILPDVAIVAYSEEEGRSFLKSARKRMEEKGCKVINADFLFGDTADQICRYADTANVDQVIIGSHGRTGLAKFMIGSTSEAVLEHCRTSVIVYRNVEPTKQDKGQKSEFSNILA